MTETSPPFHQRLRRKLGGLLIEGVTHGAAAVARLHPLARPKRHGVEVRTNLSYGEGGVDHQLDLYLPTHAPKPWPVVLYVHGGGFRILSKDTHWVMGLAFAKQGYLVCNINYRLAKNDPYPAGFADTCAAYQWLVKHIGEYGGDLERLVLAGESAGANLVTSLAIASSYRRPEPWARAVFDTGVRPRAVVAGCGILEASNPQRFANGLSAFVRERIFEVSQGYLRGTENLRAEELELANPLVVLERGPPADRPLPPFFASVGTADPLQDDTRRLKVALDRLGVECDARYYEKEMHAFQALIFRARAQQCWRDTFEFLDGHVAPKGPR